MNTSRVKEVLGQLSNDDSFFDTLAAACKRNQDLYVDAFKTGFWIDYNEFNNSIINYLNKLR